MRRLGGVSREDIIQADQSNAQTKLGFAFRGESDEKAGATIIALPFRFGVVAVTCVCNSVCDKCLETVLSRPRKCSFERVADVRLGHPVIVGFADEPKPTPRCVLKGLAQYVRERVTNVAERGNRRCERSPIQVHLIEADTPEHDC